MKDKFEAIYAQFRLEFYKNMFSIVKEREGSLSATEMSSAEIIYLLKNPSIKEFADFIEISQPNATYKVKALIDKGYIKKVASVDDKREYHLEVTEKFLKYYSQNNTYGDFIFDKIKEQLNEEEIQKVDEVITLLLEKAFKGEQ